MSEHKEAFLVPLRACQAWDLDAVQSCVTQSFLDWINEISCVSRRQIFWVSWTADSWPLVGPSPLALPTRSTRVAQSRLPRLPGGAARRGARCNFNRPAAHHPPCQQSATPWCHATDTVGGALVMNAHRMEGLRRHQIQNVRSGEKDHRSHQRASLESARRDLHRNEVCDCRMSIEPTTTRSHRLCLRTQQPHATGVSRIGTELKTGRTKPFSKPRSLARC